MLTVSSCHWSGGIVDIERGGSGSQGLRLMWIADIAVYKLECLKCCNSLLLDFTSTENYINARR
jgi:hypothetical protein